MEKPATIIQRISGKTESRYDKAYKYFQILSIVNNIHLVKRDLQLLAFSVEKEKPVNEVKKEFAKEFKTTMPTIGNIISKLYRKKVLQKDRQVVRINEQLLIDFSKPLLLAISLNHIEKNNNGDN